MSIPMNMEEWQMRMRAQKDKERQKKTESAKMLQGYRGGVKEEDLKLAALRQEDRKKQMDAERYLHEYRGIAEAEAAAARQRPVRHDPDLPYPPVTAAESVDPSQLISPGLVSEKAANLRQKIESVSPATLFPSGSRHSAGSSHSRTSDASHDARNVDSEFHGDHTTFQDAASAFDGTQAPPVEQSTVIDQNGSVAHESVSKEETTDPFEQFNTDYSAVAEPQLNNALEKSLDVAASAQMDQSDAHQPILDSWQQLDGQMGVENTSVFEEDPAEKFFDVQQVDLAQEVNISSDTKLESEGYPSGDAWSTVPPEDPIRYDVAFSFGLVTAAMEPAFDRYLRAVEQIVLKALEQSPVDVSYDPSNSPHVRGYQRDENYVDPSGRPQVQRILVTVVVPLFLKNESLIEPARNTMLHTMQSAIQSGSFLLLAQHN